MKTNRSLALALLGLSALALQRLTAFAQGTAFTYQGQLSSSGASANGFYDLVFTIYDLPTGPGAFANQTNSATPVSNGLFTVTLDFGPGIFTGAGRWLEIAARTNGGGGFTTLAPRQKLTPSPYAITAGNVVSNGLASGPYSAAVTFNNAANSFTGNGVGLTGVNAATLGGVGSNGFWRTTGNAGTTPGLNFLGTTDNQALAVKVNNTVALQIKPGTTLPNLVGGLGGFRSSVLAPGVSGAVIVGGNAPSGGVSGFGGGDFQAVYDNDGTVGGGWRARTGFSG